MPLVPPVTTTTLLLNPFVTVCLLVFVGGIAAAHWK
jgi:hypothetical protein